MTDKPAILGGKPIFDKLVPIVSPTLPKIDDIKDRVSKILDTGMITNFSENMKEFENKISQYLNVKNTIALSNATSGLMLIPKIFDLKGEVITPSFTFHSTTHSLIWNNLKPVFIDINEETYNIDSKKIEDKITDKTSAILATHIFGNPCEINDLERIAKKNNLKLIFDAAHAMGSIYRGKKIGGFGDAEVFSLSATKLLVTGEGGVITTNSDNVAEKFRLGRNYGDPGTYDCKFIGLNSKMQEFSAILGLKTLEMLEDNIARRNELVNLFKKNLNVSGIKFQKITKDSRSTYKDFSILIDEGEFGVGRDKLYESLKHENIITKKYFYPAIHQQTAYKDFSEYYQDQLPNTENISKNILCLPIYSHMSEEMVNKICEAITKIKDFSSEIK